MKNATITTFFLLLIFVLIVVYYPKIKDTHKEEQMRKLVLKNLRSDLSKAGTRLEAQDEVIKNKNNTIKELQKEIEIWKMENLLK